MKKMKTIEDFDWTEIWNKAIDGSHWGQRAGMPARAMGCGNLSITGLSFLGLGAQPPTPEWGAMLNEGKSFMTTALHLMIFPGLMIMIVVLAFNFLGDGLRDALDPRLRQMMMK